jgi:cyclohexadienyl dehydratase
MSRILITTLILLFTFSASAEPIEQLLKQRLGYMKDVAAYKWHKRMPVEDKARELLVLKNAVEHGLRFGFKPESSRQFFQIQIEAAKEIQQYWITQWNNQPREAPSVTPDLNHEIRPALILLGNQITQSLASVTHINSDLIRIEGLSTETLGRLANAIMHIQRFPNRLAQVLSTGVLRIGTTGDYAPFSLKAEDSYQGVDIDMGTNLAESLGVEITWIATTWPTLMSDLAEGKFDIGMSGISINLVRQRTGLFSSAYHQGGKTPIIRCTDIDRFRTLTDIDQQSTRLVVNPGGTNQLYVASTIHNAKISIHENNRTIFSEIANNRADVMITDDIEVELQSKQNQELCAAMPGQTLTYSEKGYLLAQDIIWKEYIDVWLSQQIGDGTVSRIFSRHLAN